MLLFFLSHPKNLMMDYNTVLIYCLSVQLSENPQRYYLNWNHFIFLRASNSAHFCSLPPPALRQPISLSHTHTHIHTHIHTHTHTHTQTHTHTHTHTYTHTHIHTHTHTYTHTHIHTHTHTYTQKQPQIHTNNADVKSSLMQMFLSCFACFCVR